MATAAVIATQLTTPATRVLSVFAGGLDVTGDVKWDKYTVTDSGTNAKGTANIRIERTPSAVTEIRDQAMIRVEDHSATGGEAFRGFVRSRRPGEEPEYSYLELIADDISSLLDDIIIDVELRQPESMQARIGYLWGKYAGAYLSGDQSNVNAIGGTLPLQRFALLSLRNAIEMTIAQASSTADYSVDMLGKLHVWSGSETGNPAPKNIDTDAPAAGEIAPQSLDIDYDSKSYANRVFVSGATPAASGYFQDDAAITAANGLVRTATVQAPDCTTADMAESLGLMYLGRVKTAKPRGVFVTTSAKADGWRGGQQVEITSAAHGLTAQSYRIARVTTKVLGPGSDLKRQYTVEFGGARAGAGLDGVAPLIAGSTAGIYMLDQLGNAIVSNAAVATLGGLGPAVRRFVMTGVMNSDFYAPPPGPDAPIDDATNPLAHWSFVQASGSAVRATSEVNLSNASGRSLQLAMASGAAGDEAYLEQIVPVNGSVNQAYNYRFRVGLVGQGVLNNILVFANAQFLKVDGITTTGAAAEHTKTMTLVASTTTELSANAVLLPTDAYFLRVRIGLRRDAAANGDTCSVVITDSRLVTGTSPHVWVEELAPATYAPTVVQLRNGVWQVLPGSGTTSFEVNTAGDIEANVAAAAFVVSSTGRVKHGPQGCIATRALTQTITTATWTPVQFNTTDISDPFGFHDPATNNTRFTVPTGWGGTYMMIGHSGIFMGPGTRALAGWGLNGATPTPDAYTDNHAAGTAIESVVVKELAAGDYVEFMVYHDAGVNKLTFEPTTAAIYYIGELA